MQHHFKLTCTCQVQLPLTFQIRCFFHFIIYSKKTFYFELKTNFYLNQISTLAMKNSSAIALINASKTLIITHWNKKKQLWFVIWFQPGHGLLSSLPFSWTVILKFPLNSPFSLTRVQRLILDCNWLKVASEDVFWR